MANVTRGPSEQSLSDMSWDTTQARMSGLIRDVLGERTGQSQNMLVAAE